MMQAQLVGIGQYDDRVAAILAWPAEFIVRLREQLISLSVKPAPDDLAEMVRHGVLRATDGHATALGEEVRDILVHESWLAGDELDFLLRSGSVRADAAVLDVGCSTGWALRQLPGSGEALRVGVDTDMPALAIGALAAEAQGQAITFRACRAESLPFEPQTFDWVWCRNALNYLHQRETLHEMMRVLRTGGQMFLRFENVRYDLLQLLRPRVPLLWFAHLRDFAYGAIEASSGWQPTPGGLVHGSRTFVTLHRLREWLEAGGCRIRSVIPALKCPRFLGRPTQTSVLVEKG